MKKVNKSLPPNELTDFQKENAAADWSDFRDAKRSAAYKALRSLIISDQGGLCAYCEQNISTRPSSSRRLEHFHSKSDTSQPGVNWALEWSNVIAVCLGGSSSIDDDHTRHPMPTNLSCDAFKAHLENCGKISKANEGNVLNPQEIPAFPNLFTFDKATGELKTDYKVCGSVEFQGQNVHASLSELVDKTIEVFNLNCQRLCDERLVMLVHYSQQVARARKANNKNIFDQLAARWFSQSWPSFFTTRRALLGKYAESYLISMNYEG